MTELKLYKFVQGKEIDWRGLEGDILMLWVEAYDLKEFAELVGDDYLCEGGEEVYLLQNGTVAIGLNDICECFEIEPTNILPKEI